MTRVTSALDPDTSSQTLKQKSNKTELSKRKTIAAKIKEQYVTKYSPGQERWPSG